MGFPHDAYDTDKIKSFRRTRTEQVWLNGRLARGRKYNTSDIKAV